MLGPRFAEDGRFAPVRQGGAAAAEGKGGAAPAPFPFCCLTSTNAAIERRGTDESDTRRAQAPETSSIVP